MNRNSPTRRVAVIAVLIVLALMGEVAVSILGPEINPGPVDEELIVDSAERTWEGGGSRLLFVDDVQSETAAHLEKTGSVVAQDYYGGALPEEREGSARWAQERYRWGSFAMDGEEDGWLAEDGAWRFGGHSGMPSGYPAGTHSELVTPVIDLRSVPAPPEFEARMSAPGYPVCGERELSVRLFCLREERTFQTVDNILPTIFGITGLQPPLDPSVLNQLDNFAGQGSDVEQFYRAISGGHDGRKIDEEFLMLSNVTPTAALRLRHAYDFQLSSQDNPIDGGRLEISRFDEGRASWTPWRGISPTDRTLRIGDDEIRGRFSTFGTPAAEFSVRPRIGEVPKDVDEVQNVGQDTSVDAGVGVEGVNAIDTTGQFSTDTTHMYAGPIGSSVDRGGPWRGFGNSSEGLVESVFDLSLYAGSLLRMRFVTSTADPGLETPVVEGFGGWLIDQLEVHASDAEPVTAIGLASPGEGAVLEPGSHVEPKLALHNTGRTPVETRVTTDVNGESRSHVVNLGVGNKARAIVPTGHVFSELEADLYKLSVSMSVRHASDAGGLQTESTLMQPGESRFHFAASHGGDWKPRDLTFTPLVDLEGDGEWVEDPSGTRSMALGQPARIHVFLDNLGPSPQTVRLGASADPDEDQDENEDWDVRPVLVDEVGNEFGTIRPVAGGEAMKEPVKVELPPSREISGTAGAPGTTKVTWEWSGTDNARMLNIVLRQKDGDTVRDLLEGGAVAVQTTPPPVISEDYGNPWRLTEGTVECVRFDERVGAEGVVHCPADGENVAQIVSPVQRIQPIDLQRGSETAAQIRYQGGPMNVTLQVNWSTSRDPPSAGAAWDDLDTLSVPLANEWSFLDEDLVPIPTAFEGYVRLKVDAEAPVDLDLLRLAQRVESAGQSVLIPVVAQDWDVIFEPDPFAIEATTSSGIMHVHGRDNATEGVSLDPHDTTKEVPIIGGLGQRARVEKGDLVVDLGHTSTGAYYFDTGRIMEDSLVVVPGPLDLSDVARAELDFRSWRNFGPYGQGFVEAAPVSITDEALPELDDEDLPAVMKDLDWQVLTEYRFDSPDRATRAETISLSDYAGEKVHLRFRYHIDPGVLSRLDRPMELGWAIEDVKVSGWNATGPVVVHEAKDEFGNYSVAGANWTGERLDMGIPNRWEPVEAGFHFDGDVGTVWDNYFNRYGLNSMVTSPIDIGGMKEPTLNLTASFDMSVMNYRRSNEIEFPVVDVEYQVRNPDGTWPAGWTRANPVEMQRSNQGDFSYTVLDPSQGVVLVDPVTGLPNGRPFNFTYDDDGNGGEGNNFDEDDPFEAKNVDYRFALDRLHDQGALTEPVRMRLHVWSECMMFQTGVTCTHPGRFGDVGTAAIHSIEVGEFRHTVDAATESIRFLADDSPRLSVQDPAALEQFAPNGRAVVGSDLVDVAVEVSNAGSVPLDLAVQLQGVDENGNQIDLRWVEVFDDGSQRRTNERTGIVTGLLPGERGEVIFRTDLLESPPGGYTFSARVDVTNSVDTNPANDRTESDVRLLPFRDLEVDTSVSSVQPFAAAPGNSRVIRTTVVNRGNVDESRVDIDAEIVQMTGLTDFEVLDLSLPEDLFEWHGSLARRGDGRAEIEWSFDPTDLLPPSELEEFEPGEKYAVKISVSTAEDSVRKWWTEQRTPLHESTDGTGLLNVTRMPVEDCECALIPFLVERQLYESDFTATNSTSVAPEAFPVESLAGDGWQATTFLEGEPLQPGDRPDLPKWRQVPADATDGFEGRSTGRVWQLPEYDGLELLRHELVSPSLPSHLVRDDSRAILNLRHATESMTDDQVRLEARTMSAGQWGDWEAVETLRSQRVAIVLAPDFPSVIAAGLSNTASMYNQGALVGNHPMPPFYDDPLNQSYILENGQPRYPNSEAPVCLDPSVNVTLWKDGGSAGDRCRWSPPPDFNPNAGANRAWLRALNQTLLSLASNERVGPGNIGLFTTLPDDPADYGIGEQEGEKIFHTVDTGNAIHRFPIQSLDDLGLRLDTYGAILLMGDNLTTTYPDRSIELLRRAHGPDDWGNRPPSEIGLRHHEELFTLLSAAPDTGVRVLGAIGPASATLAQSGAVDNARLAVWQSVPSMPERFESKTMPANLHCTGSKGGSTTSPADASYTDPDDPNLQPLLSCRRPNGGTQGGSRPDTGNPHNYWRISPQDAQSLALRDLIRGGGGRLVDDEDASTFGGIGDCDATHPLVSPGSLGGISCHHFQAQASTQTNGLDVITAAWPNGNQTWIRTVLASLEEVDGTLPATGGAWSDLPPESAFPVGGAFWRDGDGEERFDGMPMQIRLTVETDPDAGGHGAMGIDRVGLLGTNRTRGVGVQVVTPEQGAPYKPGGPFVPVVQVTNRGVERTEATSGTLEVEHWIREHDECTQVDLPDKPFTFQVGPLDPGEQVVVEVPGMSRFPIDSDCSALRTEPQYAFNFTANLIAIPGDDDPLDDVHEVTAIGQERVDFAPLDVRLLPAQESTEDLDGVALEARVQSESSQTQRINMRAVLVHARPLPCEFGDSRGGDLLRGCGPDDEPAGPIPLQTPEVSKILDRGQVEPFTLPIEPVDPLEPGVYRVLVEFYSFDSYTDRVTRRVPDLWLHVAADDDVQTARKALPPDGGWATDFTTLDPLQPPLPTHPQALGWHNQGVFLQGSNGHSGAYGDNDPTTTTSSDHGSSLAHGWRLRTGEDACADCGDSRTTTIEWRREGTQALPDNVNRQSQPWVRGQDPEPPTFTDRGHGDFGPDRLIWIPHDPQDDRNPDRTPYLTLASFEDPELSMLARWQGTENTVFIAEMQIAQRPQCGPPPGGDPRAPSVCPPWNWTASWIPLAPEIDDRSSGDSNLSPMVEQRNCDPLQGSPAGSEICRHQRFTPSNALAGQIGLWGSDSKDTGPVAELDDGWVRLRYPINYGTIQSSIGSGYDTDPSLYHGADDDNGIARPVRFRLSAASFGGDSGESFWEIADVGLTSHRLDIPGPQRIGFSLSDADDTKVPVRVQNTGSVEDRVEVSWRLPSGTAALEGANVELSRKIDFEDPKQEIVLNLEPGETRTIWVKIETEILDRHPGTNVPVAFLVQARSLIDPTTQALVALDGSFQTRAWPELETIGLVLDDDDTASPFTSAAEGVPLQVAARIRNVGDVPAGGPQEPVEVRLVAREIDPQTGSMIPDTEQVLENVELTQPVRPERNGASPTLVRFDEWLPPRVGLFELGAVVNPPGPSALPERSFEFNEFHRAVPVGPVRFADLHVTDLWLVEFRDGCGDEPVDQVIAGHVYCLAASVENRGRQAALEPQVAFGIGAGQPFSHGAPSLPEIFESDENREGNFPPAVEQPVRVETRSSPRVLGDRVDGTWSFYAEVSSRSVFPTFENKSRQLDLPVFRYGLELEDAPANRTLVPGAKTFVGLNVTNTGNAPITPVARLEGPGEYGLLTPDLPRLFPGGQAQLSLSVVTSANADAEKGLPEIVFSSQEDDLIEEPVPTRFDLESLAPPRVVPLAARALPGPLNAFLVLDNTEGPEALQWRLVDVRGPVHATPQDPWASSTKPFERNIVPIPMEIDPHTPPGYHDVRMRFAAVSNETEWDVRSSWPIHVDPNATLHIEGPDQPFTTVAGTPLSVPIQLANDGNVPLDLFVRHEVDGGTIDSNNETFRLLAGDTTQVQVTVTPGRERVLGETRIAWSAVNGERGEANVTWTVDSVESRLRIATTDLNELDPTAHRENTVTARIENPGTQSVIAEVLAVVDGEIHARIETPIEAGAVQDLQVPFEAGPVGDPQEVMVLVRPLGSPLSPDEPGLWDVGDAQSASLSPREPDDTAFPVPAVGPIAILLLLGGALFAATRRRPEAKRWNR